MNSPTQSYPNRHCHNRFVQLLLHMSYGWRNYFALCFCMRKVQPECEQFSQWGWAGDDDEDDHATRDRDGCMCRHEQLLRTACSHCARKVNVRKSALDDALSSLHTHQTKRFTIGLRQKWPANTDQMNLIVCVSVNNIFVRVDYSLIVDKNMVHVSSACNRKWHIIEKWRMKRPSLLISSFHSTGGW